MTAKKPPRPDPRKPHRDSVDGGESQNDVSPKPSRWRVFLESSGGTALITVLIGGIMGTIITALVQVYQKDREFQNAWMKTRGEQALAAYNDYLTKEQETVKNAYELIGHSISASDDLIDVTTPDWNPSAVEHIDQQRSDMIDNYNKIDVRWRTERETVGLLMTYFHHGQRDVASSWHEVQDSVTGYMDCASRRYIKSLTTNTYWSKDTEPHCKLERETLRTRLTELGRRIDEGRRFVWEGWDTLACQKGLLSSQTCEELARLK
jgi:hypothetical protein